MAIMGGMGTDNGISFAGVGAEYENGMVCGGGYVKNGEDSFHAGASGVATYTDAFGNKVALGTFTYFGGGATDEEKYGYFANLNRIIFRYKWMYCTFSSRYWCCPVDFIMAEILI